MHAFTATLKRCVRELAMKEKLTHMASFMALVEVQYTHNPPWYKFWEKPKTTVKDQWQRFCLAVSEKEAEKLFSHQDDMTSDPFWTLFFASLSGVRNFDRIKIKEVQLEKLRNGPGRAENYILQLTGK